MKGLQVVFGIRCQGNRDPGPLPMRQLQFGGTVACLSAPPMAMSWIEMHAVYLWHPLQHPSPVPSALNPLEVIVHKERWKALAVHRPLETHCDWQLRQLLTVSELPPPRLQWDSRVNKCLCRTLIGAELAAPTDRPLTAGICVQHGGCHLSLITRNSFKMVMFSYWKSWIFSLPCLSACAWRFVYCIIKLLSTNVRARCSVNMNNVDPCLGWETDRKTDGLRGKWQQRSSALRAQNKAMASVCIGRKATGNWSLKGQREPLWTEDK